MPVPIRITGCGGARDFNPGPLGRSRDEKSGLAPPSSSADNQETQGAS
jgi:hypothetical protein